MSIHTDRAYATAKSKGAAAGRNYLHWKELAALSKRELAEVALHLAALCTDSYDEALAGDGAMRRIREEVDALRANNLI